MTLSLYFLYLQWPFCRNKKPFEKEKPVCLPLFRDFFVPGSAPSYFAQPWLKPRGGTLLTSCTAKIYLCVCIISGTRHYAPAGVSLSCHALPLLTLIVNLVG